MLLTPEQLVPWIEKLPSMAGDIGLDFETTGLSVYQGAKVFLVGFTDPDGNKFSFRIHPGHIGCYREFFRALTSNPSLTICAHNATFELSFLSSCEWGVNPSFKVWDTLVMARVAYNNHMSYSLQSCAERIGESKHAPMLEWLKSRGNKGRYHEAPEDLIVPYVEQDAWLSWKLRQYQVEIFKHWDVSGSKIYPVVNLERAVAPHLFEMEKRGLLVDVGYCKRAIEHEQTVIENAKAKFQSLSSVPFVDSRKTLQPLFDAHGIGYGTTALGNASFTEAALAGSAEHPLVAVVLEHRRATKRVTAYWKNFLELECNGIIHPSIHSNKAQTGRMSISEPSCQNWSVDSEDGVAFPIRRAFVAREDCVIISADYSQMELRKSADEAEDIPMIERIESGADLHQEVADMAGVPRSLAKNGRFCRQYGGGVPKMAETLGVEIPVAQKIADALDAQGKATAAYSRMLGRTCKPYGMDWLGRRFYFDPGFEYKAFNYRVQAGCAEILKIAICGIGDFLKKNARPETFLMLPVHDELIGNFHPDDLRLLPELKRLMIEAHRDKKRLAMDVNIEVGPNLYDLNPWSAT